MDKLFCDRCMKRISEKKKVNLTATISDKLENSKLLCEECLNDIINEIDYYERNLLIEQAEIKNLSNIYNFFGKENQIKKFNEECFEFIEQLLKSKTSKSDLISEMADVLILINQFAVANKVDIKKLNDEVDYKVGRTLERMEKKYYEGK